MEKEIDIGIAEKLKVDNQTEWVGRMNALKAAVILLNE